MKRKTKENIALVMIFIGVIAIVILILSKIGVIK